MNITDTLVHLFSDIHSGSPLGLMRPFQWELQSVNVFPNRLQRIVYDQWVDACQLVAKKRRGKRLVAIFNGDAVEGLHHNNSQVISSKVKEHEDIAKDAIDDGLKRMRHRPGKGDRLYFVAGTETHVSESEERIAQGFSPVPFQKASHEDKVTRWCWPMLPLEINGVLGLIAHHGPGPGSGANEGNPLRNRCRNIFFSRIGRGKKPPRYVVFAHKHTKQHQQYEFDGHVVDGFILPSYKAKDDYIYSLDPFGIQNIGSLAINISVDGTFSWEWLTIELEGYQDRVERL